MEGNQVVKKVLGVVLLTAGVLALVYRGFNYTTETHEAKLGPVEFSLRERDRIEIPTWAGVLLCAAGGGLLLMGRGKG